MKSKFSNHMADKVIDVNQWNLPEILWLVLKNERLSGDIINSETGEIIIPAGKKVLRRNIFRGILSVSKIEKV